ncbi:hypothetical protein EQG63_06970 [Flavobacterium amnicola]|uniref:Uncharacterized protein n=1 Tax=Flavobacterium amnicola TaxID=2506422 RepID=A0A4Q1K3M8_9FLAO|nr:hypothetical protein [Flavobacterium amnicola]RXR19182.1 hypothetical protein EQG63_06970 [Flavobacterium amnicola]
MCFLIPFLVGLISAILGYLLGKMLSGGNDLNLQSKLEVSQAENDKLNGKIHLLEKDLEACKKQSAKWKSDLDSSKTKSSDESAQGFASVSETSIPFDAALALAAFGKKIKQDDLKIVEGIGPKIEQLYHNEDIKTWKALSETPLKKSKAILAAAGDKYAVHNPGSWAKQALMAYQGKWAKLKKWQEKHKGGKE